MHFYYTLVTTIQFKFRLILLLLRAKCVNRIALIILNILTIAFITYTYNTLTIFTLILLHITLHTKVFDSFSLRFGTVGNIGTALILTKLSSNKLL
jgi:hypothetical protein